MGEFSQVWPRRKNEPTGFVALKFNTNNIYIDRSIERREISSGPFRQEPPRAPRESPRRLPFPLHAKFSPLKVSPHSVAAAFNDVLITAVT